MATYRNVQHGRKVTRPYADEWLEKSAGWERVDAEQEPEASDDDVLQVNEED